MNNTNNAYEKMRASDDLPRLRGCKKPWLDMPLDEAQMHKAALMIIEPKDSTASQIRDIDDAISASQFGRDDDERYFDLLDNRLESLGGLDPTLEQVRDIVLGRIPGKIVDDVLDKGMLAGINSDGAAIQAIWSAWIWAEMKASKNNFIPALPQCPMMSLRTRIPMPWGADTMDTLCPQALEIQDHDAPARVLKEFDATELGADNNEHAELWARFLQQELPFNAVNWMQAAILLGDIRSRQNNDPNGLLYQALKDEKSQISLDNALSRRNLTDAIRDIKNLLSWGKMNPNDIFFITSFTQHINRIFYLYLTFGAADEEVALQSAWRQMGMEEIYNLRDYPIGANTEERFLRPIEALTGKILAILRPTVMLGMQAMPMLTVDHSTIYPDKRLNIRMQFKVGVFDYGPSNPSIVALLHNRRVGSN